MKLIIIKDKLKEAMSVIGRVALDSASMPVLKNFLVEARDGAIMLTATNLEVGVKFNVAGKVVEEGKAAIPAQVLYGILSGLSSERLNLESKQNNVHVKTDNYEATLQGIPPEEYPSLPVLVNKGECIEINADVLKESLGQVAAAAQFTDIRPELNSVFMNYSIDELALVATDSFRLAEKRISRRFKSTFKNNFSTLIPLKTVQELLKILDEDTPIKIYKDEHQLLFTGENWELISRIHEGTFPDYEAIIPKEFSTEVILKRGELMEALKLTSAFGNPTHEVNLKVLDNRKGLEISSEHQSTGENHYRLPAKISGDKVKEVGFNSKYLGEGLKALSADEIYCGLNEDNKPALLKSLQEGSYIYILMPILRV